MDAIFLGVQGVAGIADDMIIFGAIEMSLLLQWQIQDFPLGGRRVVEGVPTSDGGIF